MELYIERWLKAPAQDEEGRLLKRERGTPQGGVISPLLANLFLHYAFDQWMGRNWSHLPFERYADDIIVHCRTEREANLVRVRIAARLKQCGLELHPEKTKVVDLREGREGFDFLGCHFRARVSGRLLERGIRRYYLQRWPSMRAMKRIRVRIKALTGRGRVGIDIREVIAALNPILRGWGNYFRTGNAGIKFIRIDRYVTWRLTRLLIKKRGRNLRAGQADQWTEEWFNEHGLHRPRGTIRYPQAA